MKIKKLSIKNFRCHKCLDDIPFHDLTTFIGENDCGKTTIIDFLDLMIGDKKVNRSDFFQGNWTEGSEIIQEDEIIGEILFKVNSREKISLKKYLDKDENFKLKRVFNKDGNDSTYFYGRKFKDERLYTYKNMKAAELKILLTDLGLKEEEKQELRKEAVEKHIDENKDNYSIYKYDWVAIKYNEIKNFMPKFIRYNVDDYKNPNNIVLKTLQEVFENEIYDFDESGERICKIKELEEIMNKVSNNLIDASNKLIDYVKEYNDKIEDVSVEPEIDLSSGLKDIFIKVKDNTGMVQNLDDKGYGTKKRIFMAIMEWTRNVSEVGERSIIRCYDEPDNNLHIEAQRKLFKTIKSNTEDRKTQVIICTHSLFMIDSSPTDYINYIKRSEEGTTSIEYLDSDGDEEIEKFIHNMCREMGLSNSHIFFEKCFVLVEGPTEVNFLPIAYKKLVGSSMAEDGISLINLGGNGSAINFLKLLIKNKRDLTVVFLDKDSEKFNKQNLMKPNNRILINCADEEYEKFLDDFFKENVIFIGNKEFEDSFSSQYLSKVLNKNRSKIHGQKWLETEIEKIKCDSHKFSDELVKEASKNSHEMLTKPELGLYLAEDITEEDLPSEIEELFVCIKEIIK